MPEFYGTTVDNALMLATAQYPSPAILAAAFCASGAAIAIVSRRCEQGGGHAFADLVRDLGIRVLPNTAACHTVNEAVTTAHMARELFDTKWIKLEVIGHTDILQPDVLALIEAAGVLIADGFEVFPYWTEDMTICGRLLDVGCQVLMPWGAPIGSGLGLNNTYGLRALRSHLADVPLVVDAGISMPSHAARAMETGYEAVLLNTAVAPAGDPAAMARAMALAVEAGRAAFFADPMEPSDMAAPSDRKSIFSTSLPPFYPIFDSADWIARMLPLGVKLVQLRIKDRPAAETRSEIRRARDLCRAAGAILVVNDHWQIAKDEGCDWLHLGQEDLDIADLAAIAAAGLLLGISTHEEVELARALALRPDYITLGPVWPTILTHMKWHQLGVEKLTGWRRGSATSR